MHFSQNFAQTVANFMRVVIIEKIAQQKISITESDSR